MFWTALKRWFHPPASPARSEVRKPKLVVPAALKGKRLVFFESVEDNICKNLADGFRSAGLETYLETSFEACLKRAREEPPDVVVMITNNTHEGPLGPYDLANEIRAVHASCGFVFLTGCDIPDDGKFLTAGYKFRIHGIPLPIRELMDLIVAACDSPLSTFVAG
jgi:hypothetical protein